MGQGKLFINKPGVIWRKERALRMVSDGKTLDQVCLELGVSLATLEAWIKSGLPDGRGGDPDLDQLSLYDGLSQRERNE